MPRTGLSAEEIKNKAIDSTIEKMRAVGFDKVRLVDIAKDLGVSHAALYSHFKDKAALLDAVSEQWLLKIDRDLQSICDRKFKDACDKILAWMLELHRAKVEKVLRDPQLYRAFDLLTTMEKPFAQLHMRTLRRQLVGIVEEALAKKRLRDADPEVMATILHESMLSFHHPRLVAQHITEKREPMLRLVLDNSLRGLGLKS